MATAMMARPLREPLAIVAAAELPNSAEGIQANRQREKQAFMRSAGGSLLDLNMPFILL